MTAIVLDMPAAVSDFIAQLVQSNVRELEGAVHRVIAAPAMGKQPVTLGLAQNARKDLVRTHRPIRVPVSHIKQTVAEAHGLTVREMDNGRRDQRLAGPRQIAMYVTTELTGYSLPQIAREFGKKDHTTVMYAPNKIRNQMRNDENFRNKVRQLVMLCQTPAA